MAAEAKTLNLKYDDQDHSLEDSRSIYNSIKRLMDLMISIIGLFITLPVILVVAIFIKIESPGPIFFYQERVGYKGKTFQIIKLRSMKIDAEKNGPQWASKNDNRVTKVGSFIRKTRIDELPQFINVIKGDMSLIGPRPERPVFTEEFNKEIPGFINRLAVKPGLTGWAQINGGYEISPKEKLIYDLEYINKANIWLDIKIVLLTVKVIVTGHGAR
jgi:exopolysaccharide biosynthesis polyprenyl glycosylphosphotransferase